MDPRNNLKEQALALEESEQWQDALAIFLQLAGEGGPASTDPAIWNRIGNLQVRLGNAHDAVTSYGRGATLFDDAGLVNNAIALRRKSLQAEPERAETHLEIARLAQRQGFAKDARSALDDYERLAPAAERSDDAFALQDLVSDDVRPPAMPPETPAADISDMLVPNAPEHDDTSIDLEEIAPLEGFETTASEETESSAGDRDDEDNGGVLPLLDLPDIEEAAREPAEEEGAPPELSVLQRRVAADESDLDARESLVRLLYEQGDLQEMRQVAEATHATLAAAGRYSDAADMVGLLLQYGPTDTALLQKRVEYASLSGESSQIVAAYLALARHLKNSAGSEKAGVVYKRILELDPQNEEARKALAAREYVDFAAMVLEDEPVSQTRFVVDAEEPSGDEDQDFAEILNVFKQKLAEHIDPADAASHYDLGLAFKEMGLLDEAIAEFQVALRAGASTVATLELLGECFCDLRKPTMAVRVLEYALKQGTPDSDLLGVYYWLARAEEDLGRPARAMELYERISAVDSRFRDASRRLQSLRGGEDPRTF
ncbi:MAG TPA: hypothetical protein VFI91_03360 [Longimicrobiaceae bacterium]|nr:hypothetical protein [Longimicrobiaceae bacterium]